MTQFESVLLCAINYKNGTNYKIENLIQWSMRRDALKRKPGLYFYKIFDCYVLIDPKKEKICQKKNALAEKKFLG